MFSFSFIIFSLLAFLRVAVGFDNSRSDNLVLYWGQNSYGATHSDVANFQKRLGFYCTSDSVTNAFPLAFLTTAFGEGNVPSIDLSNICNENDNATFPGTELPNCSALASDIQTCQAAGKIVTISIGGATGAVTLSSDTQAETFADSIWNIFLGGSSSTRPFGSAVLDGVDLDIEGGGTTSYVAFVNRIRSHASGASKQYYVTAAPQCPFPDANLGSIINAVGFDAVYVQFYNNFCGLQNFNNPNDWNFATWDDWAKNTSPNSNVKVYIGAPASSTAAGSGYVDAATLANIIETTKASFSSFGGVMMWDASQAYANSRYDISAKNALTSGSAAPSSSSSTKTTTTTTTTSTTPPSSTTPSSTSTSSTAVPTGGNCAGVAAWSSSIAYQGGSEVTFNGHLWTAKWWSEADQPGGTAGDWQDDGACTNARLSVATAAAESLVSASPVATTHSGVSSAVESHSVQTSSLRASSAVSTSAIPQMSAASVISSQVSRTATVADASSASVQIPSSQPAISSISASGEATGSTKVAAPLSSARERGGRALRFNRNY